MSRQIDRQLMNVNTLATCRRFVPPRQFTVLRELLIGDEREFFAEALVKLEAAWNEMPIVGEDSGEQAIARIHLFAPNADWWIVEKPSPPEEVAFGIADLGFRELGYFSIHEIIRLPGVEVDLHWKPKTVSEIMADGN